MKDSSSIRVAVLGSGAWGTTFATVMADAGHSTTIWGRTEEVVAAINAGENTRYLPGIALDSQIRATLHLEEALQNVQLVVIAVPVSAVRSTLEAAREYLPIDADIVLLAKGLEHGTHSTVHQVAMEATGWSGDRIAVLSGPNLSAEIAGRQPTATVVACSDMEVATRIARHCHTPWFRPYVSTDVIGCEVAGATKNVFAVAIGAAEGLGLGINTRSTLITRGLAEMTRLGNALGADPATFAGLAGVGDLVATCSSQLSRNYSFGLRLGRGASIDEAMQQSKGVVEGARTALPILELAQSLGVDMPITHGVVEVTQGRATIEEMGAMLLSRPQKMDGWKIELLSGN